MTLVAVNLFVCLFVCLFWNRLAWINIEYRCRLIIPTVSLMVDAAVVV